jgi:hypothetical protein
MSARKIWLQRVIELILFCVLWIPIVLTGISNLREPWNSVGDKVSGWGLWLAGAFIWYVLMSCIGRFILKKLGLFPDEESSSNVS